VEPLKRATIIKLGGSVITYKKEDPPRIHEENVSRIAREICSGEGPKVVVLGGGAHGHQVAHAYGFGNPRTPKTQLLEGIPAIRHSMSLLSLRVEEELNACNARAVVIPPFTQATIKDGMIHRFPVDFIQRCLRAGLLVMTHGDVCFDESGSASILSGDTIVAHLARTLDTKTVLIGTDVDGIYDSNPETNKAAKFVSVIDRSNAEGLVVGAGPSSSTDVTGGMRKKLSEILSIARRTEVVVFNLSVPDRLSYLLEGKPVQCTRIRID
jgi:isopentenyl phosphate kinase